MTCRKASSYRLIIALLLLSCRTIASFAVADDETCTVTADDGSLECHAPSSNSNALIDGEAENKAGDNDPSCTDEHENCAAWADAGRCKVNSDYMMSHCARSCDSCSPETTPFGEGQQIRNQATVAMIRKMHDYMTNTVFANETYAKVRSECKNRNKDCANWAAAGECEKNPAFMTV
jgi:hypothetical protein